MMPNDIYKKIDAIFSHELTDRPAWVDEILDEIKKLNSVVEESHEEQKKMDKAFYRFIKDFRLNMYADTQSSRYPKINYNGRILGVNFNGLLYDVKSSNLLPTKEAFRVYQYLYKKRDFEIFY
jgi:hypothetical protein